ncbi:restriction endonuclease subunit S [Escherichia coli]|uniref:restriction endonuclease subunit S n=2 Tax=Escherichia coli TaxID=562 RepID=UPI000D0ABA2A|nr:restriction endonuclease subunit S [Escherichia coli]EFD0539882.1 restriction endonuclease subunit S [Escherichia coli]EFM4220010.1 restriction endonuclease subunit S [Escherichia coli]EGI3172095.1 restriction endonuclease subunit S [Escherichia coli]EGL8673860.1 restriction endonuclease subunit S [Escherichia coli]EHH4555013.1 restriction endonuclease subunit S [Escherichia coli]
MVPKGWKKNSLDSLFEFKNGLNTEKEQYGNGYKFVNVMDVFRNDILTESKIIGRVQVTDKQLEGYQLKYGDVLFNRTSETFDEIAIAAIYLDNAIATFGGFVIRARPKGNQIDPAYSVFLFQSKSYRSQVVKLGQGAIRANIGQKDLARVCILVPPLAEQKKIAQILSTWGKAIAVTEKLLVNSQKQKKALMQQLLTGKKRLLDENGVRFRGEWKWLRAVELFKTISQKNNSEDVELLAVTQDQGVIPRTMLERRVVMPDGSTKGYKLVVPGNFIISLRSFQGGLEYSRYRGLVSPAYTVLTPIKKIVDEFYKQYYKSYDFIGHLAVAVIGIRDGKQISYEDFSFLKLPYPEIEEQQKIADVLSAADAEISVLEKKLACLKDEKKALMQQLLTGKRRVKTEVEETVSA